MSPRLQVSSKPRSPDRSVRCRRLWLGAAICVLVGLLAEISLPAMACLSMSAADNPQTESTSSQESTPSQVITAKTPTCCNNCGCSDSARSNGMCCCTGRGVESPPTPEETPSNEPTVPQVGCPCGQSSQSIHVHVVTMKTIFVTPISRRNENQSRCELAHAASLPDITIRPETPPPELPLQFVSTFV